MTLDEYLKKLDENPWDFPAVEGCSAPPAEWIAVAWDTECVQGTIAYDMANEVGKNGEIYGSEGFLNRLSNVLSTPQVVKLFLTIRNNSPHREEEFRPQFEAGFQEHTVALPDRLTREEVITALMAFGFDETTAFELMGEGA